MPYRLEIKCIVSFASVKQQGEEMRPSLLFVQISLTKMLLTAGQLRILAVAASSSPPPPPLFGNHLMRTGDCDIKGYAQFSPWQRD